VGGRQAERVLVGASPVAQPALGEAEVAKGDRAAEDVGDVAGALQPLDGDGVAAVRRLQVARSPTGEPGQGRGRGDGEVVAGGRRRDGPVGVLDRAGHVARHQREGGPVHLARQPGELGLLEHHHVGRRVGQQPLHVVEPSRDGLRLATGHQGSDEADREHGPTPYDVVGEVVDPPAGRGLLTLSQYADDGALDEVGRALEVAGGERVPDGGHRLARIGVPLRGPQVEAGDVARPLLEQVGSEDVGEEMVVAVPVAAVVERDDEQVRTLEGLEHRPAVVPAGDRVAEGAAEAVEDRGVEEEPADVVGLSAEDLLDEVVHDVAVVPREPGNEARGVRAALERECRQLQRGDPALGAPLQGGDVGVCEVEADHVVQVRRHLGQREPEVGRPDLDEVAAGPQPGQRQSGIRAGADHQVHVGRQVLDEEGDIAGDGRAVGQVVVVEHHVDATREGLELVDEHRQDLLHRRVRALQERAQAGADARRCRVDGGGDIGPEGAGLLLGLLQRHPRDGAARGRGGVGPGGQHCRLAEPGRPGDERETGPVPAESIDQARARDQPASYRRDEDLGPDQRARHVSSPPASAAGRLDSSGYGWPGRVTRYVETVASRGVRGESGAAWFLEREVRDEHSGGRTSS
jgi:hypothetical protein